MGSRSSPTQMQVRRPRHVRDACVAVLVFALSSACSGGESSSAGSTQSATTPFGCAIEEEPIDSPGFEGVTRVDPFCTESGVIALYCGLNDDEILIPPAESERANGDAVRSYRTASGQATLYFILRTSSGGVQLTCPNATRRMLFGAEQWRSFADPGSPESVSVPSTTTAKPTTTFGGELPPLDLDHCSSGCDE